MTAAAMSSLNATSAVGSSDVSFSSGSCGVLSVELVLATAGHDAYLAVEMVRAHSGFVGIPAGDCYQPGATLDVGDASVTQSDEVIDRERHAVLVGWADDVDLWVVNVPSHDHQRQACRPAGARRQAVRA